VSLTVAVLQKGIDLAQRAGLSRWASPGVRSFLRNTLGWAVLTRQITARVDPKTILLAEFPRCGVTWLRFLIATGLHHQRTGEIRKLSHDEMEAYAANLLGREKLYRPYRFAHGYSVLKTHSFFDPRFERAIVIYRNPFDAIRSYYAMEMMADPLRPANLLTNEETYLIRRVGEFITYYEGWLPAIRRHPDRYLAIRYEELLTPPGALLRKVFAFLHIGAADLPAHHLARIAGLYERSDANFAGLSAAERNTAAAKKTDIFKRIERVMTPENLERLRPSLYARSNALLDELDRVRCSSTA